LVAASAVAETQERPALIDQATASPPQAPNPATRAIDDIFRDFTAEWLRNDPDLATRARYFTGEEQDRLERQLTPRTLAWRRARIGLARRGLAQLQSFGRAAMSERERVSADVMHWQLQSLVDEEPFLDDTFPLEQLQGANVNLVNAFVLVRPVRTERLYAERLAAELGVVRKRSRRLAGTALVGSV
jgi:uncharacterized protein (DUF885 family)